MKLLFLFLPLGILLAPLSGHAEYRVFRLEITSADGNVKSFLSTLDPDQYRGYYPLRPDDKISYVETWMCTGRTGDFATLCENPKATPPTEGQVSEPERTPADSP